MNENNLKIGENPKPTSAKPEFSKSNNFKSMLDNLKIVIDRCPDEYGLELLRGENDECLGANCIECWKDSLVKEVNNE